MKRTASSQWLWMALVALAIGAGIQGCGGSKSPTTPTATSTPTPVTSPAPTIASISPASGSTAGGTVVTITGSNFAASATVAFGGTPATSVTVDSATSLRATTPARSSGAGNVDVTVTVSGQTATRAGGYAYEAPAANAPPVIQRVTAQGTRRNEPANYADTDEEINVTATVTDSETSPSQLTYTWSADAGTFSGSGSQVKWKAPHFFKSGTDVQLNVTVVEKYKGSDGSDKENRTSSFATVRVFDAFNDVSSMSTDFLVEFSQQKLSSSSITRNFSKYCSGAPGEKADVEKNQKCYVIDSYTIGTPTVSLSFGGSCSPRARIGDACAKVPSEWRATRTLTAAPSECDNVGRGVKVVTKGDDYVNAIFADGRWWLCDSDFIGASTQSGVSLDGTSTPSSITFKK